jgi:hypothetical protein
MNIVDLFPLAIGLGCLVFASAAYVRERQYLRRVMQDAEPLVVDGWNTFPNEPEYESLYQERRNEAFGSFCRLALFGLIFVGLGYGIDVKHDIFAFLTSLQP